LWLAGLYFYFFAKGELPYRPLGWIYVAVLGLFLSARGRPYCLAPAYFMLFAAGALVIESFLQRRNWSWPKLAYLAALILGGLILLPYGVPVLPVATFIKYQDFLGIREPRQERGHPDKLLQTYADMFGWENMVATVARVYESLSPQEKARCVIGASNYGEAGAIDFFGKRYGLAKAISSHNSYWIWGPGDKPGEIAIIAGGSRKDYESIYEEVRVAAIVVRPHARASETNLPFYLCRRPKATLQQVRPRLKTFI
jgi:hypothetical protein